MCQTKIISQHINRIGRRSYDRRMRIASPLYVERRGELTRLLNEMDKLCKRLHDEFPTITEDDYRMFGPELKIVIDTLKAMRRESLSHRNLRSHDEQMRRQIAELEEIDHDIRAFRINAPKNTAIKDAMATIASLDLTPYFRTR